jgi:hypothetical protein
VANAAFSMRRPDTNLPSATFRSHSVTETCYLFCAPLASPARDSTEGETDMSRLSEHCGLPWNAILVCADKRSSSTLGLRLHKRSGRAVLPARSRRDLTGDARCPTA